MKYSHALVIAAGFGVATLALPVLAQSHPAPRPGHAAPQPASPHSTKPAPHATPSIPPSPPLPDRAGLDTQGPIQHGPDVQRDRRHLRAGYWRRYGRHGRSGVVYGGGNALNYGVPPAPVAVAATHNYDLSVTITWAVPVVAGGVIGGDVYQVGRRLPGQTDFWLLTETTVPSFTDRTLPPRTAYAQYRVVVRRGGPEGRGGVYGPVSPAASANLNHAWSQRQQRLGGWAQPQGQQPDAAPRPVPDTKPTTTAKSDQQSKSPTPSTPSTTSPAPKKKE